MAGVVGGGGSLAAVGVEVLAVQVGDAEGQVQGLAAVEAGIACRLVAVAQVALGDVVAARGAPRRIRRLRRARRRSSWSCGRWPLPPCCRASGRIPRPPGAGWRPPSRPAGAAPGRSAARPYGWSG